MIKTTRVTSESSTTSDNTSEFIDIVKKYDIVYNSYNPDYKNVEAKLKVWTQIADEIGLSIDAAKRKWKNLRDSYTKYLRSYRSGGKTSKKYQFWAHAEHMEFLKPFQGPGRNNIVALGKECGHEADENADQCFQSPVKPMIQQNQEEETKPNNNVSTAISTANTTTTVQTVAAVPPIQCSLPTSKNLPPQVQPPPPIAQVSISNISSPFVSTMTTAASSAMVMPIPSLPSVPLPTQFAMKPMLPHMTASLPNPLAATSAISPPSLPTPSLTQTIFPLQTLSNNGKMTLPLPAVTTATSVGCLIFDPQILSTIDSFKKDISNPPAIGLLTNLTPQIATSNSLASSSNINGNHLNTYINNINNNSSTNTKIRRVQPSPQSSNNFNSPITTTAVIQAPSMQPPVAKIRKVTDRLDQTDIGAILQANKELDSNTLFFMSLATTVRSMPTKFQSLAKMRCMRIVSDIELELENAEHYNFMDGAKNRLCDTPSPPNGLMPQSTPVNESAPPEHFVYCMSPNRLEHFIDISDEEAVASSQPATLNLNQITRL